jgi:hypothetical protein
MKKIMLLWSFLSMLSIGNAYADQIDDLFGGGENTEFNFERFNEGRVMEAIAHDAGIVCRRGLCRLTSTNTKYSDFSINLNGGIGNNSSNGFGGYGDGGSTVINFNNNNNGGSVLERSHAGINMQVKVGNCTKNVNVPRSLYYSINRYLYGLLNSDGTTRRSFTPADEAMIMFYTTVMKMAEGCSSGGGR